MNISKDSCRESVQRENTVREPCPVTIAAVGDWGSWGFFLSMGGKDLLDVIFSRVESGNDIPSCFSLLQHCAICGGFPLLRSLGIIG